MIPSINIVTREDLEGIQSALRAIESKLDKLNTKQTSELPTKYVKAAHVCKFFGISKGTLERFIAEGKIKAYLLDGKPGGDRFFKVSDVYDFEKSILV